MITVAPAAARRWAIASPMPELAPVTSARRPLSERREGGITVMNFNVWPPATGPFVLTETRDLDRGRCLTFLLEAREQPVDLAAHGRFFGRRSVLRYARKGISGMSLILDRIPAARQRKFVGRNLLSDRCGELCHRGLFNMTGCQ